MNSSYWVSGISTAIPLNPSSELGWFVGLTGTTVRKAIDAECVDIQPPAGQEIGLDVGLESFYTDSNGHQEPNPKFLRKAESESKHAQRRIYKKVLGSSGRRKAAARYSKKHLRVSRQRNEHAKRLARNVCQYNDLIAYEDLRVANMLKNHCLAKSIADASWYHQFRQWLEHFAAKFERLAVAVPPQYTSQECSHFDTPRRERARILSSTSRFAR